MKESKIVIFEGNQLDGCFSRGKKFYPENFSEEDIENSIKKDRIKLGKKYNFSGLKMFQVTQKMEDNDSYPDDKDVLIDESYLQGEDYFQKEIKADMLFITKNYPEIVLCHRMADCPVLIAEDREKGISGIVHCGIYHINRGLPRAFIKKMIEKYNCNPQNIYLYIGSHIHKENYLYDTYPNKLDNKEIWKDSITEVEGKYQIDMSTAILKELEDFPLAEIKISPIDTATEKGYASHYKAVKGDITKKGQNIVGFYYKKTQ